MRSSLLYSSIRCLCLWILDVENDVANQILARQISKIIKL